jgi:hypothetical protein
MVLNNETNLELIKSLEAAMVNEFRLCQTLFHISQTERKALIERDAETVYSLSEKKESLLDELGTNEENRRILTNKLFLNSSFNNEVLSFTDLMSKITSPIAGRISRLHQGIIAIQAEIREINRGNFALAAINLERLSALQVYLLSLNANPQQYHPTASAPLVDSPASWGYDHSA